MNVAGDRDIRKKAKKGIDRANDTTVKMILAILDVEEKENAEETAFEQEMERRFHDYEQGKITPIALDELEKRVRKSHLERIESGK